MTPSILIVTSTVIVKCILNQSLKVLLISELLVEPIIQDTKKLPLGLFLPQRLLPSLLLHGPLSQLLLFLLGHLNLLYFWTALLDFHALKLDRIALVFHFGDRESEIEVDVEFLLHIIEAQLNHGLPECCILLRLLHSSSIENEVINLHCVAALVEVLPHVAETERNAHPSV